MSKKHKKLRRLIDEVLQRQRDHERLVTYRTLTINWKAKTLDIDGTLIESETDVLCLPLVDSERPLFPKHGLAWRMKP